MHTNSDTKETKMITKKQDCASPEALHFSLIKNIYLGYRRSYRNSRPQTLISPRRSFGRMNFDGELAISVSFSKEDEVIVNYPFMYTLTTNHSICVRRNRFFAQQKRCALRFGGAQIIN
ncbi:uncharacterized protein LOC119767432 [Culex quinquefasciatus]|uniref:uncharacterized protein LOC119767432 n=1 Tax=Culex quinquefasciatus TaxID=7176 RepID=UPI0018E2E40D|nr:uncharacterized protein LOC119767432 [Culex quinquefasciatus]